jgi:hypothetical protein
LGRVGSPVINGDASTAVDRVGCLPCCQTRARTKLPPTYCQAAMMLEGLGYITSIHSHRSGSIRLAITVLKRGWLDAERHHTTVAASDAGAFILAPRSTPRSHFSKHTYSITQHGRPRSGRRVRRASTSPSKSVRAPELDQVVLGGDAVIRTVSERCFKNPIRRPDGLLRSPAARTRLQRAISASPRISEHGKSAFVVHRYV